MNMLAELRAGRLAGARRLELNDGLTEFPREIFDAGRHAGGARPLGQCNSTACPTTSAGCATCACSSARTTASRSLPESVGQCAELDIVGFKANRIRSVPAASLPPSLRWLILTDNQIETLPPAIGRCTRLQKLMLAGNQLQTLPAELAACRAARAAAHFGQPARGPARLAAFAAATGLAGLRGQSLRRHAGSGGAGRAGGAVDRLGEPFAAAQARRRRLRRDPPGRLDARGRQHPARGRETVQGRRDQRRLAPQRDWRPASRPARIRA